MKRASTIAIHQALHGYNDGHRLLASSNQNLLSKDQQTLLVMSDASGTGLEMDSRGYLTGYPLEGSGVYALARTWPAPEMPRPGCVWTHTLLIDFADLAALPDLGQLTAYFLRPSSGRLKDYSELIRLLLKSEPLAGTSLQDSFAERVLCGIYGTAKSCVLPGAPLSQAEEAVILQTWSQQWPRLRRTFSFCTHASSDNSTMQSSFDLQVAAKTPHRSNVPPASLEGPEWIPLAIKDLHHPGSLRAFLREVAIDLSGSGREVFPVLVSIYALLSVGSASTFAQAVGLAKQKLLKADSGEQLRSTLLKSCVGGLDDSVDDEVRNDFLRTNGSRLTPEIVEHGLSKGASSLWRAVPDELSKWLSADEAKRRVAHQIIHSLSTDQLVSALHVLGESASDLISIRPDILSLPAVWSLASGTIKRQLLELLPSHWSQWTETISAMIASGASDLAIDVKAASGADTFIISVLNHFRTKTISRYARTEWEWMRVAVADTTVVSHYLATETSFTEAQLYTLTQLLQPDDVPNTVGHDPWLESLSHTEQGTARYEHEYVCAYLLARALGHRSRSQAELICRTLDTIYVAAQASSISQDAWNLLDPRLPDSSYWFAWDKCKQLREGVAAVFVTRSLPPELFARVTTNETLFDDLTRAVSDQRGGRKYLREVLAALSRDSDTNRRRVIVVSAYL